MDVGYISVHSTMEWSNEASLSLLEEYRKNPVLWDSTHSFYYSKNKKQDAWELIAQAMDLNVHEVRQKMNSLLGSFRRERAKERKSLGDTRGHGKIYLSRWFAFEKMKFLLNRKSNKGIKADQSSIFEETEERDEDDQDDVLSNCSIVLKSEKEDADESVDPLMTLMELDRTPAPYVPTSDKKKIKRLKMTPTNSNLKSTVEDSRIEELLTNEPCNYDQLDQDECHTFGQHIANKLRKYNKRTRALVEHAINNVIFEADMENYSHLLSFNPSNQSDASNTNSYI